MSLQQNFRGKLLSRFYLSKFCVNEFINVTFFKILMISFHSYLSNRITSSDEKPVTIVDWNSVNGLIAYGQMNGGVTISKVIADKDQPGLYKIVNIASLTTHKHEITALCWNSRFNRLITGDRAGLSVVWVERDSKWFPSILASATGSPVTSIGTSYTGEFTAIAYENGQITCGDLGSNQKWVTKYTGIPKTAFWSGSGKTLYISDQHSEIYAVKDHGTDFRPYEIDLPDTDVQIVFAEWNHAEHPILLVIYENGDIFTHTKGNPENSIIHTGVKITAAAWSNSGKFFAFGGNIDNGRCQVQFYTIELNPIRTLNVPAQQITSISFNRTDTQLAIGIDRSLAIAQLLPINLWDFFDNTIVYVVHRNFSKLYDIVFYNIHNYEHHIKTLDNLVGLCASKNSVMIASKTGEPETSLIILDKNGIPTSSNFIQMDCKLFAKTDNYAIALADSRLCLWDFINDETKFISLPGDSSAVCAQGNKLFIGFTSDELIAFEMPSLEQIGKYNVGSHVERISVSSDMTRVSMVDIFGGLSFIDIHSGKIAGKPRKETWSMKWAEDSQDLFVALERQKLYVYHDFNATEAINSLTYICRFSGLEILTVDFAKLLTDPLNPKKEYFHTYETKLLRDVRLLTRSPDVPTEEIVKHIRNFPHKKLWKVFGEWAMMSGHYTSAEKAFTESQSQSELQFARKVRTIVDKNIQKGYAQWCFGRYEEAQQTFLTNDGQQYAIEMWATLGNWERVLSLKPPSKIANLAHIAIANNLYKRGDFAGAADHFMNAQMYEDAIRCYSNVGDIENLVMVMNALGTDDKLLIDLGCKFTELGICESAVASFLKAGDAAKAVSACIHLNRWDDAVKISEQHKEVSKKEIMGQYAHYLAGNSQNALATKMLVKFELYEDAANLLTNQGMEALKYNDYLFAKKCFVRAAFLYERCGKADDTTWFKVEALHYLMLANRSIYNQNHGYAIYAAIATKEYQSFLGEERVAALIALAGYYSRNFKQCSKGFITLEHSEKFLPNKQRRIKLLAVKIFDKNQPIDEYKADVKCPKCGESTFNMFECACAKCDFKSKRSVASGKPITAKSWRCSKCRHFATFEEMRDVKTCPLCHASSENKPTKMSYI